MKNPLLLLTMALLPALAHSQGTTPTAASVMEFRGTYQVDALACDSQGNFYIGDSVANQVFQFSTTGNLLLVEGQNDPSAAIGYPASMAVSADGRLAVADDDNNVVELFDANGGLISNIGPINAIGEASLQANFPNSNEPWLNDPEGVAFGPNNELYVGDSAHNRIAVYNAVNGAFLFAWTAVGTGGDSLSYPSGLWVSNGNVYVADSGNARIVEFDGNGNLIQIFGSRGRGAGQFSDVFALVVDGLGRIWAADEGLNKVSVFSPNGALVTEYGTAGSSVSFGDLSALAVAPDGSVLAADGDTNEVYSWATGVALAFYGKAPVTPTPGTSNQGVLAFGPVPAKAGQPLTLALPYTPESIHYEIYSADLRKIADETANGQNSVVFDQTANLPSGVYIVRLQANANGSSRQAIQKLVITR